MKWLNLFIERRIHSCEGVPTYMYVVYLNEQNKKLNKNCNGNITEQKIRNSN